MTPGELPVLHSGLVLGDLADLPVLGPFLGAESDCAFEKKAVLLSWAASRWRLFFG